MWLKLFGSSLIIFTGTYVGFKLAARCSERPRQIGQIIRCLAALKSYINYVTMPLPDALASSVNGMRGPIADLFLQVSRILKKRGWLTPREAIEEALLENRGRLALEAPEEEILCVLGANLGLVNREEQYKYIGVVETQLQKIEQEAAKVREQNVKMYQYLGICGSLALVILLI
jgi:stage III sporulation protein AB